MCCLLSKPKVSMTSLCLTAALDCHTGQSKGRYREQEHSILLVLVGLSGSLASTKKNQL